MEKLTEKNGYGVDIVQCCSSCIHNRGAVSEFSRRCDAGEGDVNMHSWCQQWKMRKRGYNPRPGDIDLEAAGKGGGMIKNKKYLMFLMNYEQPDDPNLRRTIKQIREEYESKFGTIYINF